MRKQSMSPYLVAAAILLLTAAAKLIGACGHAKLLLTNDFVFYTLTVKTVLILVAGFEISVAAILIFGESADVKWSSLAVTCAAFWAYHVGLLIVNPARPCPCLGNALDWWPWLRAHQSMVSYFLLSVLSLILIFRFSDIKRKVAS